MNFNNHQKLCELYFEFEIETELKHMWLRYLEKTIPNFEEDIRKILNTEFYYKDII